MRTMLIAVTLLAAASFAFGQNQLSTTEAPPQSQPSAPSSAPQPVPEITADLGPCSAAFHVTDLAGNGLYNAQIHVLVRYGMVHKLDLSAATNVDGRVKFVKLPNKTKKPMNFEVKYQDQTANYIVDPATNCNASFDVPLKVQSSK